MINHYPINNRLFSELDRFVTQAFGQAESASCESNECSFEESSEIEEVDATGWKLRLELPGFKKEEVSLSVDEDFLTISAETADEARDFRLEDGLLYLQVPRRVKAEPKPITVN